MEKRLVLFAIFILAHAGESLAQSPPSFKTVKTNQEKRNVMSIDQPQLFQYGVANAFIDGLYEGELSVEQLKRKGNFGIGAPNHIDGELTIVDGTAYQSNAKGQTIEAPEALMTPFAFVTNFRKDTNQTLSDIHDLKDLFARIETLLPNPNAIYALRIKGTFSSIRTRAFPPVREKPFKPLAQLLDQQQFFELKGTAGDMIGFYIPGYLSGINIVGLHFHFLSQDRKSGGHVVGVHAKYLTIEIAEIKALHLLPQHTEDFKNYKFNGVNSPNLQKIEKGAN
ncbi:acetolactate decarboxylase [Mucilaginibacter pallidiroseus]|uniref:Alpha-acetolactate decarboxylase n=1 Tax=Mucilaginibacter pallidiroseus TaxID=2599295 RepID=A0A563U4R5_9SPHI|nr:acetolactate decarboxylase [Mucilaginibacter pallidiroseus]TWR26315.1 acetolactate decarboxylase [Mucilaginibacter pallidiroseus]